VFKKYINVTKPGIVFGNLISVAGGFFLASQGTVNLTLLLMTMLGVSLMIASGCVINNVIDRDIDLLMERTKNRVLVQGLMSPSVALVYGAILGVVGAWVLYTQTSPLVLWVVMVGYVVYVGLYSLYLKRHSVYGTLVGSLSGAMPPVAGYCAVSQQFDAGAWILLLIFSLWQMPHSYAIAIFRLKDYAAASIPVLPVKKGISVTKHHIILYIIAFVIATSLLTWNYYTGMKYLVVSLVMGGYWLYMGWSGYQAKNDQVWARKLFGFSILMITALSVMMSVDFKLMDRKMDSTLAYVQKIVVPPFAPHIDP
jgi:protoheme IX farnesyltransferase